MNGMIIMENNILTGGMLDMSNIISYEVKIIANVEYELRSLIKNLEHFPHSEIKAILEYTLQDLRDNKIES